jgi:hypothetical protein
MTYKKLGITPSKMTPLAQVLNEMHNDGCWNVDTDWPSVDLALLVFLYGKGYYSHLPPQERITCIMRCISMVGGNRRRLKQIVFSSHDDRIMSSKNGFNVYFRMATTARMFFAQKHAMGGFPKEAYLRSQGTNSNCYIVAFAMWLTLKLQRDNPKETILPADTGFLARHFVIDTMQGLEDRVNSDKGGNALQFAKQVLGNSKKFITCDCNFSDSKRNLSADLNGLMDSLWVHMKANRVGLVTSFHVCNKFQNVKAQEKFGYWVFDGDSIDCEPVFVEMTPDTKTAGEMRRLQREIEEQI